jgi:hypothetical protein
LTSAASPPNNPASRAYFQVFSSLQASAAQTARHRSITISGSGWKEREPTTAKGRKSM